MKPPLPQMKKGADDIFALSTAIVSDIASFIGIPSNAALKLLEIHTRNKIESAQNILFEEVAKGQIGLLTDEAYEALIPNTMAYFECAHQGEFNHNLKILAKILVGGAKAEVPDPNNVRRISRRLQSMSLEELKTLSMVHHAFKHKIETKSYDGYHLFVNARDLVKQLGRSYSAPEQKLNSHLIDFVSRGLLFIGGNPETSGGQYYYKTDAFDEIIQSALLTLDT